MAAAHGQSHVLREKRITGEMREVSCKGDLDQTFGATMGGGLHQPHIQSGVKTEVKALLSSSAAAAMQPVSACTLASDVPPSIPWFSRLRQPDHQYLATHCMRCFRCFWESFFGTTLKPAMASTSNARPQCHMLKGRGRWKYRMYSASVQPTKPYWSASSSANTTLFPSSSTTLRSSW